MKVKELRDMTNEELNCKLKSLKQELFNLRFSNATGQLNNPMQINTCKKDIARIKTINTKNNALMAKSFFFILLTQFFHFFIFFNKFFLNFAKNSVKSAF
jgi:large subunit ribosomal protein L29